jgi:hypothetical protein
VVGAAYDVRIVMHFIYLFIYHIQSFLGPLLNFVFNKENLHV